MCDDDDFGALGADRPHRVTNGRVEVGAVTGAERDRPIPVIELDTSGVHEHELLARVLGRGSSAGFFVGRTTKGDMDFPSSDDASAR